MALFDRRSPAKALADYLDNERKAVLAGNFDVLQGMHAEKVRLLQVVAKDIHAAPMLLDLKAKSKRNNSLLEHAANGIRAAQAQLKSALLETPLRTYGPDGIQTEEKAPSALERRA